MQGNNISQAYGYTPGMPAQMMGNQWGNYYTQQGTGQQQQGGYQPSQSAYMGSPAPTQQYYPPGNYNGQQYGGMPTYPPQNRPSTTSTQPSQRFSTQPDTQYVGSPQQPRTAAQGWTVNKGGQQNLAASGYALGENQGLAGSFAFNPSPQPSYQPANRPLPAMFSQSMARPGTSSTNPNGIMQPPQPILHQGNQAAPTPTNKTFPQGSPQRMPQQQQGHAGKAQRNFMSASYAPSDSKGSMHLPDYDAPQFSTHPNGIVRAFSGNTYKGLYRNYNEDRVLMAINCLKPKSKEHEYWPRISFFGIFDGHNGQSCAEFMKNQLHTHVIEEPAFPRDVSTALNQGFQNADRSFFAEANQKNDRAGTCAVVVLITDKECSVAHVGDSRAVLSSYRGKQTTGLTKDHKPTEPAEYHRITSNGGSVTQLAITGTNIKIGPHRVFPGSLTISRALGDMEAKEPKIGGNPNIVLPIPEVTTFKLGPEHDFIMMGSDGIFDVLSNEEVVATIWETAERAVGLPENVICSNCCDAVMKLSLARNTHDNISVIIVLFEHFVAKLKDKNWQPPNAQTPTQTTSTRSIASEQGPAEGANGVDRRQTAGGRVGGPTTPQSGAETTFQGGFSPKPAQPQPQFQQQPHPHMMASVTVSSRPNFHQSKTGTYNTGSHENTMVIPPMKPKTQQYPQMLQTGAPQAVGMYTGMNTTNWWQDRIPAPQGSMQPQQGGGLYAAPGEMTSPGVGGNYTGRDLYESTLKDQDTPATTPINPIINRYMQIPMQPQQPQGGHGFGFGHNFFNAPIHGNRRSNSVEPPTMR